ncbi:MAG: hypothetical protein J6Z38_05980 [Lachnospiraceae bacterium]|nr:hypothetical protein [Lachnospiraceae bacterium]
MKHKMIRILTGILLLGTACLSQTGRVRADLIWEPSGNDFFSKHREEMRLEDHSFDVQAPGGSTPVYVSPVSNMRVGTLENGTRVLGSYSYTGDDGVKWIIIDRFGSAEVEGWVPADHLWRVYDSGLFAEQHGSTFTSEKGTVVISGEEHVCLYRYPGCPDEPPAFGGGGETFEIPYYNVFTEADGTRWGQTGYVRGLRNYWIDLDAPDKLPEELYPDGCPVYDTRIAPEPLTTPVVPKPDRTLLYVGIGVGAAALAAAAVLIFLKKKPSGGSTPE